MEQEPQRAAGDRLHRSNLSTGKRALMRPAARTACSVKWGRSGQDDRRGQLLNNFLTDGVWLHC